VLGMADRNWSQPHPALAHEGLSPFAFGAFRSNASHGHGEFWTQSAIELQAELTGPWHVRFW